MTRYRRDLITVAEAPTYVGMWTTDGDTVTFDTYSSAGNIVATRNVVGSAIASPVAAGLGHVMPFRDRDHPWRFTWCVDQHHIAYVDAESGASQTYAAATEGGGQLSVFAPIIKVVAGERWLYWLEAPYRDDGHAGGSPAHPGRPEPFYAKRCPIVGDVAQFGEAAALFPGALPAPTNRLLQGVVWGEFWCFVWHFRSGSASYLTALPLLEQQVESLPFFLQCDTTIGSVEGTQGVGYQTAFGPSGSMAGGRSIGLIHYIEWFITRWNTGEDQVFTAGCDIVGGEGFIERTSSGNYTNLDFTGGGNAVLGYNNFTGACEVSHTAEDTNSAHLSTTLAGNPLAIHANRPSPGYPDFGFLGWTQDAKFGLMG